MRCVLESWSVVPEKDTVNSEPAPSFDCVSSVHSFLMLRVLSKSRKALFKCVVDVLRVFLVVLQSKPLAVIEVVNQHIILSI